ncbi:MAG: hypothetical protein IJL87_09390 [Clostridia bacterium]|nr:hypothetical protein [Clostridia bacterium]
MIYLDYAAGTPIDAQVLKKTCDRIKTKIPLRKIKNGRYFLKTTCRFWSVFCFYRSSNLYKRKNIYGIVTLKNVLWTAKNPNEIGVFWEKIFFVFSLWQEDMKKMDLRFLIDGFEPTKRINLGVSLNFVFITLSS